MGCGTLIGNAMRETVHNNRIGIQCAFSKVKSNILTTAIGSLYYPCND